MPCVIRCINGAHVKIISPRTGNDKSTNKNQNTFELQTGGNIHKTNVLTKFHDDWTNNVTSRVFTSFFLLYKYKEKDPPGGHETNVLTKFHKAWAKNVSYRLFTCFHYIHIENTAQTPGGHETHVLTKCHEDWTKNITSRVFTCFHYIHIEKTAPPPGGHVFSPIWTIFKLFHDDWAKIVTSRVFTIVQVTYFELSRGIFGTNILTKFHEDRTRNVASRVFTRQNVDDRRTTDDGQKAIPKAHHEHVVLR
ncbi:hypothetical protein DPMN_082582 [Dreissena polymorpha]|uniref:Uncharacterized protein n=1 Tax=Dreissena polymorpha TaxID=45954 RepID=A0A9D3YAB0_DREPO|nr:hypothetical protein DPMN_082582 [Dreissena polymorpha]